MMCSTTKFSDVIPDKLVCKTFKNMQLIQYNEEQITVQSPWVQLTHYGIPRIDKFNATEESRRYLRVLLVDDDDDFVAFVKSMDKHFDSEDFRNKFLKGKEQQFQYFPMFKETNNEKYPPSMKLKLDVRDNNILTDIIQMKDSKTGDRVKVVDMDDVMKAIPYRSEVRFIFKIQRLWVQPSMKGYGVILKLRKIQVKRNSKTTDNQEDFIDSDNEGVFLDDTSLEGTSEQ